jgi:hypothetical protein
MWDLWWRKWHGGSFFPSTSDSLANYHSIKLVAEMPSGLSWTPPPTTQIKNTVSLITSILLWADWWTRNLFNLYSEVTWFPSRPGYWLSWLSCSALPINTMAYSFLNPQYNFLLPISFHMVWSSIISLQKKRPELIIELKNCGTIPPLPQTSSWHDGLLTRHRGNFPFT